MQQLMGFRGVWLPCRAWILVTVAAVLLASTGIRAQPVQLIEYNDSGSKVGVFAESDLVEFPSGIARHTTGPTDLLFVSSFATDAVVKIDLAAGGDDSIFLGGPDRPSDVSGPTDLLVDLASTKWPGHPEVLLVASYYGNEIVGFDLGTGERLGAFASVSSPTGLLKDDSGSTAYYCASWHANAVVRFDADGIGGQAVIQVQLPTTLGLDTSAGTGMAGELYVLDNVQRISFVQDLGAGEGAPASGSQATNKNDGTYSQNIYPNAGHIGLFGSKAGGNNVVVIETDMEKNAAVAMSLDKNRELARFNDDLVGPTALLVIPDPMDSDRYSVVIASSGERIQWWMSPWVLSLVALIGAVVMSVWVYPRIAKAANTGLVSTAARVFKTGRSLGYLPHLRKFMLFVLALQTLANLVWLVGAAAAPLTMLVTVPVSLVFIAGGLAIVYRSQNTWVRAYRMAIAVGLAVSVYGFLSLLTVGFHCSNRVRSVFGTTSWTWGIASYSPEACWVFRANPGAYAFSLIWAFVVFQTWAMSNHFAGHIYHIVKNQTWYGDKVDHYVVSEPVPVPVAVGRTRTGSVSLITDTTFQTKRVQFSHACRPNKGDVHLHVRRPWVFEDSFLLIMKKKPEELKKHLKIEFAGEMGQDYGGVAREYFQLLSARMFNPDYGLFIYGAIDSYTFQPNPSSAMVHGPEHLAYFKYIGRVLGMALVHQCYMSAYFIRPFYKQILGRPLNLADVETIDPDYHRSLVWMLENDITDVLDETFEISYSDVFGNTQTQELKPGGAEIPVTEDNKREYVRLCTDHRLRRDSKKQMDAFLAGFYDIIPKDVISVFSEAELELMIAGVTEIDVADWQANTQYQNYSPHSTVVKWFWELVRDMRQDDRARLLLFCTGTSMVPIDGFKAIQGSKGVQRFMIRRAAGADRLPAAHTCFNQLDLPRYESKDVLKEKLYQAIYETAGFEVI